jgi:hypothetical protein
LKGPDYLEQGVSGSQVVQKFSPCSFSAERVWNNGKILENQKEAIDNF